MVGKTVQIVSQLCAVMTADLWEHMLIVMSVSGILDPHANPAFQIEQLYLWHGSQEG